MPRRATPWFRQGRSMWYVTHEGKQVPLGVSDPAAQAAAEAAHQKLIEETARRVAAEVARQMATPPPAPPAPALPGSSEGPTVAAAVAAFLASTEGRAAAGKIEPGTHDNYRRQLLPFAEAFGPRPLGGLRAAELEAWADRPTWSPSYQNAVLGSVLTMLKANDRSLKIRRPPAESRGADTCLTDDQFARVLAAVRRRSPMMKGDLPELLTGLRETGGRPQEIARLRVETVDWEHKCTRLKQHKTKRKTGKDRVVMFGPAAMELLERQRAKYLTGLLFRTRVGTAYTTRTIVKRLLAVSKKVGFRVIAYGLGRHSFATRALAGGVPDAIVAELLGHKGTTMLHHHYSHLGQRADVMRAALEQLHRHQPPPAA